MADEKPPTGFPEPPGEDPGDRSGDREPHHALDEPARAAEDVEQDPAYDPQQQPLRDIKGG